MSDGSKFDAFGLFEDHFAKAFPGAKCAAVAIKLITADNELVVATIVREGFADRLAEFEGEDDES